MGKINVIAIFDVGKTNKKLFLFDEQYRVVKEESKQFSEIKDEDGFPCEDVYALTLWIKSTFYQLLKDSRYEIKAVNFCAYGASLVCLDGAENIILPLYNYLKPYEPDLQRQFYETYGGESLISKQTASPVLGNLNSGMQLYRLKYKKPEQFARIKFALHLPQYLSYVLGSNMGSEITSIGCHTLLWDFQNKQYHSWVRQEGIQLKLAPIQDCEAIAGFWQGTIPVGIGLHDSSAALIPYLESFDELFVLLSTGTWCISLNPFNSSLLSDSELQHDCLNYLSYRKGPVKASRLFAGYWHEQQINELSQKFNKPKEFYSGIIYNPDYISNPESDQLNIQNKANEVMEKKSKLAGTNLNEVATFEEAYHHLISDIVTEQIKSTKLVLQGDSVNKIFVDGGFSNNKIYMNLLAKRFPEMRVYAATVARASALGAALCIHQHWNSQKLPADMIEVQLYPRE